jgi:hypothetical protein
MPFSTPSGLRVVKSLESIAADLAAIRACVCQDPTPEDDARILADTPWVSQLGPGANYAPGDCGPACVAMWAGLYDPPAPLVDDVSKSVSLPPGYRYTMPAHIMNAMRHYGHETYWRRNLELADLTREIDAGHPCILLVEYDWLPIDLRYDINYKNGHWILVNGYEVSGNQVVAVYYHDPYWSDSTGAFLRIRSVDLVTAWGHNHESNNSDFQAIRIRR